MTMKTWRLRLLVATMATVCCGAAFAAQAGEVELWASGSPAERFNAQTGESLGWMFDEGPLHSTAGMTFGPDGNLYAACDYFVERYDGETRAYLGSFIEPGAGGLEYARCLTFAPDGDLYVSDAINERIARYDGATGAFVGIVADTGLLDPTGLLFDSGFLYVANTGMDEIRRYDAVTGELVDIFGTPDELDSPATLLVGPDGYLYVTCGFAEEVVRYDLDTGEFLGTFADTSGGVLPFPFGMTFGPDGNLYVSCLATGAIGRFDPQTGAYIDRFAHVQGGDANYLFFVPEPGSLVLLLVGAGAVLRRRR